MPKSRVSQTTVSVRNARCSLKYCLIRPDFVVAADLRVDVGGDHLGAEGARGAPVDPPAEDQRHLLRLAHIEVVADELFEERPPSRRPVKHPGVGDLELAERQLLDISGAQVLTGQRGRQPPLPAPEEALHRARPEPIADPLQRLVSSQARNPLSSAL